MELKSWLDAERGRYTALASHLNLTVGRISQMADHGVPPKFMLEVRDFTSGAVTLEDMVAARTPGNDEHRADARGVRPQAPPCGDAPANDDHAKAAG